MTQHIRRVTSYIVAGLLCAGGLAAFLMGGFSANARPSRAEERFANLAKEVVIPFEAQIRHNPIAANEQARQAGLEIYQRSCSTCHGEDGRSQGAYGRSMYPPAMDLTSPHVRKWSDAELFWIVENGVRFTGMPGWHEMLDEESTWRVVLAIRQLQQAGPKQTAAASLALTPEQRLREGALMFRQENCVGCHKLNGEGGGVGPDLTIEGDRGRTNQWLTGHFKNPPAYVPGSLMPATINLNDDQLQALTDFLQAQHKKK